MQNVRRDKSKSRFPQLIKQSFGDYKNTKFMNIPILYADFFHDGRRYDKSNNRSTQLIKQKLEKFSNKKFNEFHTHRHNEYINRFPKIN